jgi:hypothetical protein
MVKMKMMHGIRFHNHGLNTEETPVIPDYYPNMEIQV